MVAALRKREVVEAKEATVVAVEIQKNAPTTVVKTLTGQSLNMAPSLIAIVGAVTWTLLRGCARLVPPARSVTAAQRETARGAANATQLLQRLNDGACPVLQKGSFSVSTAYWKQILRCMLQTAPLWAKCPCGTPGTQWRTS